MELEQWSARRAMQIGHALRELKGKGRMLAIMRGKFRFEFTFGGYQAKTKLVPQIDWVQRVLQARRGNSVSPVHISTVL